MVETTLFIQGIIIGLLLAAPVGPISLICIQRTVADGKLHGILSGIGVTTADSVYGAVTYLGLTVISGLIIANESAFRLFAGVVLLLIGIRICLFVPATLPEKSEHESYLRDYLSMFAIAIANPLTVIFFAAVLPGFGVVFPGTSYLSAAAFVGGVFCGSSLWWVFLCSTIGSFRSRIGPEKLRLINRLSGIVITGIGVVMILIIIVPAMYGAP
jgi:threonine/homoserine/homoserine lactone efflux protein